MASGGKRRGAGRPAGARGKVPAERAALQAYFDAQAVKEFAPVVAQYFRRAKGQKTSADPKILIDLLNRTLGKPIDSVQLSGDGDALNIRIVHQELKE